MTSIISAMEVACQTKLRLTRDSKYKDWISPLDEIVFNTIKSYLIDARRNLYEKDVVSDGVTLFKNLDQRVRVLGQHRVDDRMSQY
jgi:hypothetical protein